MSSSAGRASGRLIRSILFISIIAALALTSACGDTRRRTAGLKPVIRSNVIERAPVGLRMDVTKFNWQYIRGGSGLQVTGTVRNNTRKPQQPVVLYAMLFDETGKAVGMGETRISPSSLAPGAQGSFTLVVATSRPQKPRPIKYLRLLTNFQNN
ncbi:hypothetical protein C4J81_11580 [Deltaproteobacteria bacterium Smac51]|nr:hypothetical protein C4J81_11580 [Deltaproteobacteria bacterium Smac51]